MLKKYIQHDILAHRYADYVKAKTIPISNQLNVYHDEAFRINGNQARIERYLKYYGNNIDGIFRKKPLTINGESTELSCKVLELFNFGEISIQDFIKIRNYVFQNLEELNIPLYNSRLDRDVLLVRNNLSFGAKWQEMEKTMKTLHALAPLHERVKIPQKEIGLEEIQMVESTSPINPRF